MFICSIPFLFRGMYLYSYAEESSRPRICLPLIFSPTAPSSIFRGTRKILCIFSICLFLCHTQFLRYTFIHLFILKSNQKLLLGCHDNVSFVPLCLIQHPPLTPTTGKVISISICNSKK